MLDDLREWDNHLPPDAHKLLVIFRPERTFGANGTPTAVLVDANGRVASQIVGGAG